LACTRRKPATPASSRELLLDLRDDFVLFLHGRQRKLNLAEDLPVYIGLTNSTLSTFDLAPILGCLKKGRQISRVHIS
jgi:hypothetical protein